MNPREAPPSARAQHIVDPRAALAAVALLAVVMVALIAGVIIAARTVAEHARIADNRTSLRQHAPSIITDVFSVDAARWQVDRARARSLVAADFAGSFAAQLRRAPSPGTATVRWRPETVALIDVGTDDGNVLVRASVTTRTDTGVQNTEYRTLRAGFERHDGTWLLRSAEVLT